MQLEQQIAEIITSRNNTFVQYPEFDLETAKQIVRFLKQKGYLRKYNRKHPSGEINGNSKLTTEDVIEIKKKINKGSRLVDLANEYGVSDSAIDFIKRGIRWKNIIV